MSLFDLQPNNKHHVKVLCIACVALAFVGCMHLTQPTQPITRDNALFLVPASDYPQFKDDLDYKDLAEVLLKNITYLEQRPKSTCFYFGTDCIQTEHMIKSQKFFLDIIRSKPSVDEFNHLIKTYFNVYQSEGTDFSKKVLFTGYYEPFLRGSRKRIEPYIFPIYPCPDDMIKIDLSMFSDKYSGETITGRFTGKTVIPYYDRRQIDLDSKYETEHKPILWVDDPIDLFFLHIQGSGKVVLPDKTTLNVLYHCANARAYVSIGKLLIDQGKIPKENMSMQALKAYLRSHPQELNDILHANPSYVFFRIEKNGPVGNLQIQLTQGRSIATDQRFFPKASLAFIQTEKPIIDSQGKITAWQHFGRFALNQDTGGAIKGPGRCDIFWGNGQQAEITAGHLQHRGELFLVILKKEFL
ncbi:MAG: murein transglycosylase A [Desulfobacterales bacterium]|nr:murein transglycosylase A [Desulfobacterales bacterium]